LAILRTTVPLAIAVFNEVLKTKYFFCENIKTSFMRREIIVNEVSLEFCLILDDVYNEISGGDSPCPLSL
jgi:hypothetical protein